MPEWPHLSGLRRGERCPDLPDRQTRAAGAGTSCYLAAERRCTISTTTPASGISVRTAVVGERVPILAELLTPLPTVRHPVTAPECHRRSPGADSLSRRGSVTAVALVRLVTSGGLVVA